MHKKDLPSQIKMWKSYTRSNTANRHNVLLGSHAKKTEV